MMKSKEGECGEEMIRGSGQVRGLLRSPMALTDF
jgi:hypothetical protein